MNGQRVNAPRWGSYGALLVAFILALFLHGAVPGSAVPTLGQALWTSGFAMSFGDSFPPVATHFGAPAPAPIAFGLAGAYPVALFLSLGLHPVDAYSAMVALWIGVALAAAWRLALRIGLSDYLAVLAAFIWISMPVIWAHAGYSMVALGFALLPFYFLAALRLISTAGGAPGEFLRATLLYVVACVVAVFMDGYSFMMFAIGSSLLLLGAFIGEPRHRKFLVLFAGPIHALAFGFAYFIYTSYIGRAQFDAVPITFFRGWGADITFFLRPTAGIHWLWDVLHLSDVRSAKRYFGDASVWTTTFILPLAIAGLASCFIVGRRNWLAASAFAIALFGLYMALGPSFKFNSFRPAALANNPLMPGDYALTATGTAWLSKNVPGFNAMRASYRWVALAGFALWFLSLFLLAWLEQKRRNLVAALLAVVLIASNLPHPLSHWREAVAYRHAARAIDRDLVADMRRTLRPGEMVAFLPYRNDFFVNYLAPAVGFRTYNIGGDKNLFDARTKWPPMMAGFGMAAIDERFASRVVLLLAKGEADAVVLPYIDLLWAPHQWPAPPMHRPALVPIVEQLTASGLVNVEQRDNYAVVRLTPDMAALAPEPRVAQVLSRFCLPPRCIGAEPILEQGGRQAGRFEAGTLRTDGRAGFLHFGPYAPLAAGTYRLTLFGSLSAPGDGWADIVSSKGALEHGRFALPERAARSGVILEQQLKIDRPAADVEVRLWVSDRSDLALTGYRLERID